MKFSDAKKLECPKCLGELRKIKLEDKKGTSIAVDQCYACSGIWFDKGEFQKALTLKLHFNDHAAAKEIEGKWRDILFDMKTARCPLCKKDMERIKNKDGAVILDHCSPCDGIWLDGGEIRLLMKGRPLQKAIEYLMFRIEDAVQQRALRKAGADS